jgi:hypothetical protein
MFKVWQVDAASQRALLRPRFGRHARSRASLYALWNRGQGPGFYLVGTKRVISVEAAASWRLEGEARAAKLMRSVA